MKSPPILLAIALFIQGCNTTSIQKVANTTVTGVVDSVLSNDGTSGDQNSGGSSTSYSVKR